MGARGSDRSLPEFTEFPLRWWGRARNLGFTAEGLALNLLGGFVPGALPILPRLEPGVATAVAERARSALEDDAREIREGIVPLRVLEPELPSEHFQRLPWLLVDGMRLAWRRHRGKTTVFSPKARKLLKGLPRYYQRNFHFQTDGYLSEGSAAIYEHQVEILFGGLADPMRRLVIRPLSERWQRSDSPRLLELGVGTGRATRFQALTLPDAQILGVDLSAPYLRVARRRLEDFESVSFLVGKAEALPFRDHEFEAVTSVFLFHELPEETRRRVIQEAFRVLKPGGVISFVDSLQLHDDSRLGSAFDIFPAAFHEPFYRNYQQIPLEDLVKEAGFGKIEVRTRFLAKGVSAEKPR